MVAPNVLVEALGDDGAPTWTVTNGKGERLLIRFDEVLSDSLTSSAQTPGSRRTASRPSCRRCSPRGPT
jgi:hypothetical protein